MIKVEHLRVTTDRPIDSEQARRLATDLLGAMNTALAAARDPAPRWNIGELRLNLPHAAIGDSRIVAECATAAVQRILDRTPE